MMKYSEFIAEFAAAMDEHLYTKIYNVVMQDYDYDGDFWAERGPDKQPYAGEIELFSREDLCEALRKFGKELQKKGE